MAQRWKDNKNTTATPTNDCLGISRQFFCSYKFPSCIEKTTNKQVTVEDVILGKSFVNFIREDLFANFYVIFGKIVALK
jgi:hypothetical protein